MTQSVDIGRVLAAYGEDCQPSEVEFLGGAGGFSGALFWQMKTPRGTLCLRRWPKEHPSAKTLEFIHAALWYASQEGCELLPVPMETKQRASFVQHSGYLWELTPWLPGKADYRTNPSREKLRSAMWALAEFHEACHSFPVADSTPAVSPTILAIRQKLDELIRGGLDRLHSAIAPEKCPELEGRSRRLLQLFPRAVDPVIDRIDKVIDQRVALQPCACDIWCDHVLFVDSQVSGLIDFGAMKAENISRDIARLLGSMAESDQNTWEAGLSDYQREREVTDAELFLVSAFDGSHVLMSGLNWIQWIYCDDRTFEDYSAIAERLDRIIRRLERFV